MKTIGIIAEYNPFHKGHAYQIQKARQITGADHVIVVMSGDFVQRGAPAILNKYTRTAMALSGGADLVIELPLRYATGSAEYFAAGAVSLLDSLGCVDYLCFGSESGDLESIHRVAQILLEEPQDYRKELKAGLAKGLTFPAARMAALLSCKASENPDHTQLTTNALQKLLSSPNNILGIEYCKQLTLLHSTMSPLTIQREGSAYHAPKLSAQYPSATAIRNAIHTGNHTSLMNTVPDPVHTILKEALTSSTGNAFTQLDDYSLLLKYKLMNETPESLPHYQDVTPELSNRIYAHLNEFTTYTQFIQLLKTKDTTHTRIARALLHTLLNIPTYKLPSSRTHTPSLAPYARVLGFRRESANLLTTIKQTSTIPLITKPATQGQHLSPHANTLLKEDIQAANLYETVQASRTQTPYRHEYTQQLQIQ